MPFFGKSDFAGIASTRIHRTAKLFEATLDRAVGDRVRDDGACGVDLWCAIAGVEWSNDRGDSVTYSHRRAGDVVAWVREEGSCIEWYASGEAGHVADWIGDALREAGWSWRIAAEDGSDTGMTRPNPSA